MDTDRISAPSSQHSPRTFVAILLGCAALGGVAVAVIGIIAWIGLDGRKLHSEICDDATLEALSISAVRDDFSITRFDSSRRPETLESTVNKAEIRDLILSLRPITTAREGAVLTPDHQLIWQSGMDPTAIRVRQVADSEELEFEVAGRRFVQGLRYTGGNVEQFRQRAARFFEANVGSTT